MASTRTLNRNGEAMEGSGAVCALVVACGGLQCLPTKGALGSDHALVACALVVASFPWAV